MPKSKTKTKKLILPLTLVAILTISAGWFFYSKKISVEFPEGKAASLALDDNGSNDLSSAPFNTSCGTGTLSGIEACGVPPIYKLKEGQGPSAYWTKGIINLDSAKNESESFQMVVRSASNLNNLKLKLNPLIGPNGAKIPVSNIRVYKEYWVDVNAPVVDMAGNKVYPSAPVKPVDNQPDPLYPLNPLGADIGSNIFNISTEKNSIFWVTITVPAGTAKGTYTGNVDVLDNKSAKKTSMAVSLTVRNFALPKQPILKSMISVAGQFSAHGATTNEQKDQLFQTYYDEFLRNRLSPFLYDPAFKNLQNEKGTGDIKWEFKDATGTATMDFTGFDAEAKKYFNDFLNDPNKNTFSSFNVAPSMISIKDGKPSAAIIDKNGVSIDWKKPNGTNNPVFDDAVTSVFSRIYNHLNTNGWLDRAVYYAYDEPNAAQIPALKRILPLVRNTGIKTAISVDPASVPEMASLVDGKGNSLVSYWVPYYSLYNEKTVVEQKSKGADYWIYDVKDTALITDTGLTNRSIFWDAWKRDAKGYIYYNSTYWGLNPWKFPNFEMASGGYDFVRGDGYFFYPPKQDGTTPTPPILDRVVPSIRWELMREGSEDYDYLRTLEDLIAKAGKAKQTTAVKTATSNGNKALADARTLSSAIGGASTNFFIRDLTLPDKLPSLWSADKDNNWLYDTWGEGGDLTVKIKNTGLKVGKYNLSMNVENTLNYHGDGRDISRFKVNGVEYRSTGFSYGGVENIQAGTVDVNSAGECSFTLSPVAGYGVVAYQFGLQPAVTKPAGGLYGVRKSISDSIETLKSALGQ